MIDTLSALDSIQVPGDIRHLNYQWSEDDSWKDRVMRPSRTAESDADNETVSEKQPDDRLARTGQPQYQSTADQRAAMKSGCPGCVFLESPPA